MRKKTVERLKLSDLISLTPTLASHSSVAPFRRAEKNQQPKNRNKRDEMSEKSVCMADAQSKAEIKKCFERSYPCGRS